jgi:peptidoglycan/LPS O-acetylase OafA/YrhL
VKESSNLDLLRSFAVACVFVSHLLIFAYPNAKGVTCLGTVGVLCFFVHTSYVLLLSIQRSNIGWTGFQIRRVFRIYPLSMFGVAFYFLFKLPCYEHNGVLSFPSTNSWDLIANFFLIQNFTGSEPVPNVLWSLPFEVQMYLLLPLVFLICMRFKSDGIWSLYLFTAIGIVLLVVAPIPATAHNVVYQLRFVPCFLAGAILFTSSIKPRFHWSGMFLIMAFAFAISSGSLLKQILLQWLTCLIVALCIPLCSEIPQGAISAAAKTIARYSYGVYIFHMAAFDGAFALFKNPIVASIVGLIFTGGLSFASNRWIEEPMIAIGKRLAGYEHNLHRNIHHPRMSDIHSTLLPQRQLE